MTDSRLQQLKRAWEASGSVQDEAAYLRERVRVGELSQERLELAAYCGREAALSVCGPFAARILARSDFSGLDHDPGQHIQAWCYELPERWSIEPALRLGLEFAWNAEAVWRGVVQPPNMSRERYEELVSRPCRALRTIDAFLCDSADGESIAESHALLETVLGEWGEPYGEPVEEGAEGPKWEALGVVERFYDLPGHLFANPLHCDDYLQEFRSKEAFVGSMLHESLLAPSFLQPSKAEVAAWALGFRDPSQERMAQLNEQHLDSRTA